MGGHAKLAPSAAHRWLNCPGSIELSEGVEDVSSEPAMKGSIAHCLGEICLVRGDSPERYKGYYGWDNKNGGNGIVEEKPSDKSLFVLEIKDDMIEAVSVYVDSINLSKDLYPEAEFSVEEKLDVTYLVPDMYGTGDHLTRMFLGDCIVDDYKNGFGVVEVKENPQLMIYGLGALGENNPHMMDNVVLRVTQPNAFHSDGPIRAWSISVKELYEWGQEVLQPGANLALTKGAPLVVGEWCTFCPAKRVDKCPKQKVLNEKAVDVMFGNEKDIVTAPFVFDINEMSGKDLDDALEVAGILEERIKILRKEAYSRLEKSSSNAPESLKLVAGRKTRKWNTKEAEVSVTLRKFMKKDDMFTSKMKTVAQMEKALKKAGHDKSALEGLVEIKQGVSCVPVSDKRLALPPKVDQMFN